MQSVSLHIDQDSYFVMNKSVSPPKKLSVATSQVTPNNAAANSTAKYQSGKGTNASKFNLVNRGALSTGQFPAVVNANRSGMILSPQQASNRATITHNMATQQNFMKSS